MTSWWVGLDRQSFQREVAKRDEDWRKEKRSFADFVGSKLREAWVYDRPTLNLRGPIK
jgi:hypothetical protein